MKGLRMLLLLLVSLLCLASCAVGERNGEVLEIRFLDVGQGDAILLRTPDGDILIDAGTEDSQETLCLRLEQLGVTELLLAILTHTDEDHIGGADGVLETVSVRELWVNGDASQNESAERLFQVATQCGIAPRAACAGEVRRVGDVLISVLLPLSAEQASGNEGSIVVKVTFGEFDMLLTGDAGAEQEEIMLERYGAAQLDCELYKVGHHGSNTSSSQEFLGALSPDFAVISCGAGNSYGHPMGEVLARLNASGATVLRTDLSGEIVFTTDGHSWSHGDV